MILQEMIVTDSEGKTTKTVKKNGQNVEVSLNGQCIQGEDIYTFYAIKSKNYSASASSVELKASKVYLTLPIGGNLNGMYRFPRIGEKVLVVVEGAAHYLMSYLPSKENLFDEKEKTDVFDEEGLVLRYKKMGENVADANRDEKYSEIGFYKEPSRWQTQDANLKNTTASVETEEEGKKIYYPYIDQVKISSTGDVPRHADLSVSVKSIEKDKNTDKIMDSETKVSSTVYKRWKPTKGDEE